MTRFLITVSASLFVGGLFSSVHSTLNGPVPIEIWPAYLLNSIGYQFVFALFSLSPLWIAIALYVKSNHLFVLNLLIWFGTSCWFWSEYFTGVYASYVSHGVGFLASSVLAVITVSYFRWKYLEDISR